MSAGVIVSRLIRNEWRFTAKVDRTFLFTFQVLKDVKEDVFSEEDSRYGLLMSDLPLVTLSKGMSSQYVSWMVGQDEARRSHSFRPSSFKTG
jgi:hypothetical protein